MHVLSSFGRQIPVLAAVAALLWAPAVLAQDSGEHSASEQEMELPDSFFGSSPSKKALSVERPAGSVPVFPKMGVRDPRATIEYFYAHDCLPCAGASAALHALLEERSDLQVVFHPVAADQAGFDDALAETILYASEPSLFSTYHFASMAAQLAEIDLDRSALLSDLIQISDEPDLIIGRFEHYEGWATGIPLNAKALEVLGAESLPVFVVNNAFYEGFTTAEALAEVVENASSAKTD